MSVKRSNAISSIENYKNGSLHGDRKEFYDSGRIHIHEKYTNGTRMGLCQAYYDFDAKKGFLGEPQIFEKGYYTKIKDGDYSDTPTGGDFEEWKVRFNEDGEVEARYKAGRKLRFWEKLDISATMK